ncbi:MAG: hypothetical protein B1H08_03230 [Candidatus Omnitrophica bacterium 4484_171]|nr:MAG: hypothetical protein B1H08_03230 [Candidatus Omnitrophica bacterium 4484_171]
MVKKISIIGSGSVGSNLAFCILSYLDIKDLVLVDIAGTLAEGVALDLEDTRSFIGFNTNILGTSNIKHIKDSDIVVITSGIPRKEGMSRLDLFKTNSKIAIGAADKIKRLAPASIIIVVTNPLDLITYVVYKHSHFNRQRVMGMGSSLDSARLANLIHKKLKVSVSDISALVIGPHSKDMIPLDSFVKIKGAALDSFMAQEEISVINDKVKLRGKEIVSFLKKKSASFAPALSCLKLIEAVSKDKNEIIPVSTLLEGEYGLKDMCIGIPCIINRRGVSKIIEVKLNSSQKKELCKAKKIFLECMM